VGKSANTGRKPIPKQPFTEWPMSEQEGRAGLEEVLASWLWVGHARQHLRRSLPRCVPQSMGCVSTQERLRSELH